MSGTHFHLLNETHREIISLAFLHRNKFVHCFSLPGIPVPVSEFPVHVPVQNKYARIPVTVNYPGTGSAQPLGGTCIVGSIKITTLCKEAHSLTQRRMAQHSYPTQKIQLPNREVKK